MNDGWNRVLREARRDWGVDEARRVDWDAVDDRLFARLEEERRAERRSLACPRGGSWKAVTAGLVAAAAIALVAGKARERRSLDTERATATPDGAGSIVGVEGEGEVLVAGRRAAVGTKLRLGDVLEARGARATVSRPGRLTLVLERGSVATVTHVQGALVLALARGAIEAQVVPVASGEALAVDVGPSRVAVHGTHFRVARADEHVVVDLSEGVVSVGEAPRVGSTLGGLVTAPAHAEFYTSDAQGTLQVTHDSAAVRAPVAPVAAAPVEPPLQSPSPSFSAPLKPEPSGPGASAVAGVSRVEPRPVANASSGAPVSAPDPNAEAAVAAAVRACMAERLHADDVTIVVSTTLYLQLNDDGSVRIARFEPPVVPDVNACAAQSIYRTHFTHGGGVTIPISVKN